MLADSETLVPGLRGSQVKNPALQVQRDSAVQIRAFAQEFGLTPSSRTGVQTRLSTDDDENNPFGSRYGKGSPFAGYEPVSGPGGGRAVAACARPRRRLLPAQHRRRT